MAKGRTSLPVARAEWARLSLCNGLDSEVFFAEGRAPYFVSQAKFICYHCPVRMDCLQEGLKERVGVWGGTVHLDRIKLRRALMKSVQEFNLALEKIDSRARKEYGRRFGWDLAELMTRLSNPPENPQEARLVVLK